MKKFEFETSKGMFVLFDNNQDDETVINFLKKIDYGSYINRINLSEITEEQASKIVDLKGDRFQDYNHVSCCDRWCNKAIKSLHSLIKSKRIHLFENPVKLPYSLEYCSSRWSYYGYEVIEYRKAEQKTFYNPYIFKIK